MALSSLGCGAAWTEAEAGSRKNLVRFAPWGRPAAGAVMRLFNPVPLRAQLSRAFLWPCTEAMRPPPPEAANIRSPLLLFLMHMRLLPATWREGEEREVKIAVALLVLRALWSLSSLLELLKLVSLSLALEEV